MNAVELTPLHQQAIEAVATCLYDRNGTLLTAGWTRCLFLAALFVDRLEAVNDMPLKGIAEAAAQANAEHSMTTIRHVSNGECEHYGCEHKEGNLYRVGPEPGLLCRKCADARRLSLFDFTAFFSALAVEGIAKGTVLWQVKERDGWRDVTAPHRWGQDERLTVDWPSSLPDLCVESVTYDSDEVRQRPGTVQAPELVQHARFELSGREFIIPAIRIGGAE